MFPFVVTVAVVGFVVMLCEFAVGFIDLFGGLGSWVSGVVAGIALCEWLSAQ